MSRHRKGDGPPTTRRRFTQTVALAALGTAAPAPAAADDDPLESAAQALGQLAEARYGKHLSPEQQKHVIQSALRQLHAAERLSRVPLTNADGPFPSLADLP